MNFPVDFQNWLLYLRSIILLFLDVHWLYYYYFFSILNGYIMSLCLTHYCSVRTHAYTHTALHDVGHVNVNVYVYVCEGYL